jgi:alpha-glucosidase
LPDDVQFKNDGYPTDHLEAHNVYGSLMARATFEGVRQFTGKRPFVITRACYAGTQKYSTVWTGDNQSFWEHLRMSIPMLCNLSISGMSFIGTDVGGFSFDCTGELLSRWVQVGAFTPLFRNHSAANTRDQEPWAFDTTTEEINRKYIQLRYRMIPYFYDQFWHAEATGLPLIRPLFLMDQSDSNTLNLNDQFMCGDSILVAPVVQQGQTRRQVYLPRGDWYDYWNKQLYNGGTYILYHAPLDTCPIFIKAGALLPNDRPQQYIGELAPDVLVLEVYPYTDGGTTVYHHIQDDGESYDYQSGGYNEWRFTTSTDSNRMFLSLECTVSGYEHAYRSIECHIFLKHVLSVSYNGADWTYTKHDERICVSLDVTVLHEHHIEIQF